MCLRGEESRKAFSGSEGRDEAVIWETTFAHVLIRLGFSGAQAPTVSHFLQSWLSGSGPTGASRRLLRAAGRHVGFTKFPPLAFMQELGPWRASWLFK